MGVPAETYNEDFFNYEGQSAGRAALKIVPLVAHIANVKSVLDVGCGTGMFLRAFHDAGVQDILGVDGNYVPAHLRQIPATQFKEHDLTKPLALGRRFDVVMSLEVAEHLPGANADGFIDVLCGHGDVVLFSAALPGQGGTNHVNEQWPDYWAAKFKARGFTAVDILRPMIWSDPEIDFWYRQNLLIFANAAGLARNEILNVWAMRAVGWTSLNLVHPDLYARKQAETDQLVQTFAQFKKQLEDFNSGKS